MQSAGNFCMSLYYLIAVSANFNKVIFELNGVCMQSAGVLKLLKCERNGTLLVSYGVLYTCM